MRLWLEEAEAIASLASVLDRFRNEGGRPGEIELRLIAPDLPGEVVVDLPGQWPVTPQIKGALKSLPGVAAVEDA